MTAGTVAATAEGAPVDEEEPAMAAVPTEEGASLEEAKMDTDATETGESDHPQPEETEPATPQVNVMGNCWFCRDHASQSIVGYGGRVILKKWKHTTVLYPSSFSKAVSQKQCP